MAVIGVCVGTVGAEIIEIVELMNNGELYGLTYGDIPELLVQLSKDSEYMTYVVSNLGLGLVFACLGCFSFLRRQKLQVSKIKVVDLNEDK